MSPRTASATYSQNPAVFQAQLAGIRTVLAEDPAFGNLRVSAAQGTRRSDDFHLGAPSGLNPVVIAELVDGLKELDSETPDAGAGPSAATAPAVVLAVTATGREAEDLAAALRAYLPEDEVAEFPNWETLPHERLSPRSDTVGRRLTVLRRLAHPEAFATPLRVVVAPVRAVVQPVVAGLGDLEPVTVRVGAEEPFEDLVRRLAAAWFGWIPLITIVCYAIVILLAQAQMNA
ncbi:MAG: hypothetical protein J7474_06470, partial [Arthrobacter sp.]|nr:hypothetical protein [Arthrobacter sp.]